VSAPSANIDAILENYVSAQQLGFPSKLVGAEIANRIVALLGKYLILDPAEFIVLALWTLHTHLIDCAEYTPYMHVTSPTKRCGKSRVSDVLEHLVARPWKIAGCTPAALVRKIDGARVTLLLDEVDAIFGARDEQSEIIRGILNNGFKVDGVFSKCEPGSGGRIIVRDFRVFGPKLLMGIGALPDTIADRSIPIRMRRKARHELVERLQQRSYKPLAMDLAADIETWAAGAAADVMAAEPPQPLVDVNDRAWDISEPLVVIADVIGGEWPDRARDALRQLLGGQIVDDDDIGTKLLGVRRPRPDAICAASGEVKGT
jgi:hypothetical protein